MRTLQRDIVADAETRERAAASWYGKAIRDVFEKQTGLVHGHVLTDDGSYRLLARFPGESDSRQVALERVSDGHYLDPDDPRARYRPLTADEQATEAQ